MLRVRFRHAPRYVLTAAAVSLAVAFVACGGSDEGPQEGDGPPEDGAVESVPLPDSPEDLAEFILTASGGLPNVGWDGVNEPVVISYEELPEGYRIEAFAAGLEQVASAAFAPDGRLFLSEQHTGHIRVIAPDGTVDPEPFATLGPVAIDLEVGFLGLTLHPDFPDPPYVYAFFVEGDEEGQPVRSILLRFVERDGRGADPTVLLELPGPLGIFHAGGGLGFGPDGKLYVMIGDGGDATLAQNLAEPAGKLLRLNEDGSTPDDNPFVDEPGADPRVFAYGFRETFDIVYHPGLDAWLGADNAPREFDEINVIRAGRNYGWNEVSGFARYEMLQDTLPDIADPIWVYLLPAGVAGIEVYTGDRLAEFKGDVFVCQFHRGGLLHRLRMTAEEVLSNVVIAVGCRADVLEGPDGFLYFLDGLGGTVWRIVDTPGPEADPFFFRLDARLP